MFGRIRCVGVLCALVAVGLFGYTQAPVGQELLEVSDALAQSMAREHESWIVELTAALPAADRERLYGLLGRLKRSLPPLP